MNILSHRNNIVLFLACNMAAMQNLYTRVYWVYKVYSLLLLYEGNRLFGVSVTWKNNPSKDAW